MTVGERMKKRREEMGLSVVSVAGSLGISRATVYRYEAGDIKRISFSRIKAIADVLKTSPTYLVGWKDERKIP